MNDLLPTTIPPQTVDMEQAALGACLISTKAIPKVLAALKPDDFYNGGHRRIFACIKTLAEQDIPIDILTVEDELKRRNQLDGLGGTAYLDLLIQLVPTAAHVESYASKIREKSNYRKLIQLADELKAAAFTEQEPCDELRQRFLARLIDDVKDIRRGPIRFGDALATELARLTNREPVHALGFGIESLDRFCGGVEDGDLGVIAGTPGTGKTALLHGLCDHATTEWGKGLCFSLEINEAAFVRRGLARATGYSYRELKDGCSWASGYPEPFTQAEHAKIAQESKRLRNLADKLWIEPDAFELDDLVARAHDLHSREGIRFIALDYAQLVEVREAKGERRQEVERVTRACKKRLAGALKVPVFLVSSVNRDYKKRSKNALLEMSDLAESSAIEYAASLILLLNPDPDYPEGSKIAGVIGDVKKCRNDATGLVKLIFNKPRFAISGVDDRHDFADDPYVGTKAQVDWDAVYDEVH